LFLAAANIGFIHRRTTQTLKVFDMDMSRVIPRSSGSGDKEKDDHDDDDPNVDVYPRLTQQVGSRRYISPEISQSKPYNLKSDVYSFGLIVWEMLSLHPKAYAEFEATSDNVEGNVNNGIFFDGDASLDKAILVEGRLRPTLPRAQWSKELADLVAACWHHDLHQRPTMKEALQQLQQIHQDLSSSDTTGMVPSSTTNEVCRIDDQRRHEIPADKPQDDASDKKEEDEQTLPTVTSSITANNTDDVSAASSSLSHSTPTEKTSQSRSRTMKKSQSWCSLVNLGMVNDDDDDEGTSDEEYVEEEEEKEDHGR
jgi:serine/threonine protein kinase